MLNSFLTTIRTFITLLVLSFLLPAVSSAQNTGAVAKWLESYRSSGDFQPVQLFDKVQDRSDLKTTVDHASALSLDRSQLNLLLETAPLTLQFQIPTSNGETYTLEMARVDILAPEFSFGTLGENARDNVPVSHGLYYRGIMQGNDYSLACLSIFPEGLVAMATDENGTYQLARMEDGSENYVFYKTADLHAAAPYSCFTDEDIHTIGSPEGSDDRSVGCKTVQIYFECDYQLYLDKGSNVTNVNNYVTALFNQVATLYANENISVSISQIYVWNTPDPYISQTSTSGVLNAFRTTRGANFNGNLAHFLSTRSLGGGIAFVDAICVKEYAFGVSAIYNSYQNVPTYSWTVEVVTHELGHNLGSWHTHSCSWPGGALDNCVTPEGSCPPGPAPVNGGTIMSYCHLTNYGINFNNGFGSVPGNWIRSKVLAASCLSQTGNAPTGLTTTNITSTSAQLNWGAVTGTTSYSIQYKLSTASTWTSAGSTSATTMTISGLSINTAYNWQVKTDCSNFSATANFTT
ncbi:MAG: M12 family metallo-peptidase, partial [Bacteroidota bacterium]